MMTLAEQVDSMQSLTYLLERWSGWVPAILFAALSVLELVAGHKASMASKLERIGTNIGLYISGALLAVAIPLTIAGAAAWAARNGIGLFNKVSAPALLVLTIAIVGRSFAAYWLHRASHHIPLLWRLHRVHHGDRQVDVSLGLRHHPLELIPAILLYAGLVVLLGMPVWTALATEAVMVGATFWEHLAIRLPGEIRTTLEPWIVVPETHLIHHSAYHPQTDSNFSSLTIIWDRMFGTFRPSREPVSRIGLGDLDDEIADSLWQQLLLPLRSRLDRFGS